MTAAYSYTSCLGKQVGRQRSTILANNPTYACQPFSLIEIHAVITNRSHEPLVYALNGLLEQLEVEIIAFDIGQARLAQDAYSRFGRGSGHPARLNFGDTMVYALSASEGEALAFLGDDFNHTDLETVRLPPS